ncbi:hypothetical protein [Terrihabitans sp. B22-R8]|uniref:hypothetical protein n=1 Tax=Terrihabitans sp. B22-R8 TaxID=3425128 RepID=UPI00403C7573
MGNVVIRSFASATTGAVLVDLDIRGIRGTLQIAFDPREARLLGRDLLAASDRALEDLLSLRQMGEGDEDGVSGSGVHHSSPAVDARNLADAGAEIRRNVEGQFR